MSDVVEVSIPFTAMPALQAARLRYRMTAILPRGEVYIAAFQASYDPDEVVRDLREVLGTDDVHLVIEGEDVE